MMSNSSGVQKTYDVFVGNLQADIGENFILQHFKKYGKIASTQLKEGTRKDGTQVCFIRYVNREDAVKSILDNTDLNWSGSSINVSAAQRGGSCWYEDPAKKHGNKAGHEVHKGHKPDKVHVGHQGHRPPSGADVGETSRKEEIVSSFHESPIVFWGQPYNRRTELNELSDQLQQVCPVGQSFTSTPNKGKIYAAMYSADGMWYRCCVTRVVSDTQVEVSFLDFGNSEVKNNSEIKELLPNLSSIRPFALRYCLYGLKLAHDSNSMGFVQGCQKFVELTEGKKLLATICKSSETETGMIPVILESETVDVNQEMLSAGFAICTRKSGPKGEGQSHLVSSLMSQSHLVPSLMPQSHQGHPNLNVGQWMPDSFDGPPPGMPSRGMQNGGGGPPQTAILQKLPRSRQLNNNGISSGCGDPQMTSPELMHLRQVLEKTQHENQQMALRMQQLNEAKNKEASVIKREWDSTTLELEATKMNLRKLREEYTVVLQKQKEQSLPQRLKRLVESVERVKGYRIQFPSEDHAEDLIERAFDVANEPTKVITCKLPITEKVEKAKVMYDTTQNAIRASENGEQLSDLIGARDACRLDLHTALTAFVDTAQQMPLSNRSQEVEKMLVSIRKTYGEFLRDDVPVRDDITNFDEAYIHYKEWKSQKVTEFAECRTRTNTCHNGTANSLRILQEQLSLDTPLCANNSSTCSGLDELLNSLQEAVDEEARKTNLISDEDESDTLIVATLLRFLEGELRRELQDIVHLRKQLAEYSSYANRLAPWLDEKPKMEPITSVRKNIKSLKSKLRHKLADLQDMEEESEDSSNEDYLALKEELASIRLQLHMAFLQEDEILADLADLNENHFPELSLQYPDLAIEVVKQYNGLVKQGRALDQFSTEPMPFTQKKNVQKTVFCGKDCVLKEYIIDEAMGVKKTEFLRRALFYNQIINPHILPIEALFFTGAGRQVYVQLPHFEKNLTKLIDEGPLSMEHAYHILCKVLEGLQAIHAANLVFGAIHPNNVLIGAEDAVVLTEIDFSKSPHQRAGSFTTRSKLCFQPPEFQKQEISWASDMYNFGLLALWLHFPSYKFTLRSNGVPDFSPLEMDRSLEQLLMSLLQEEPASRCMASSTWQQPYFANSPHSRPSSPKTPHEEETLQLRRKSDGGSSVPKNGNGILKNKGTTSPTSSPIHSPQSPQKDLTVVTEIKEEPEDSAEETYIKIEMTTETPKLNGTPEDSLTTDIVNEDSAGSTPVLVSSPQGTPVNTPAERESGNPSPPEGEYTEHCMAKTTGLVNSAMLQASKLADLRRPDEEHVEGIMPTLDELSKSSLLDEVARLEAEIMAQTSAMMETAKDMTE